MRAGWAMGAVVGLVAVGLIGCQEVGDMPPPRAPPPPPPVALEPAALALPQAIRSNPEAPAEARATATTSQPEAVAPLPPPPPPLRGATAQPQRNAYALVIGIEKYRDLPAPAGARADAEAFAAMLKTTLGLPEANVHVALDDHATQGDINAHLAWLKANVPANGRAYFFFSGHGAPSVTHGTSNLVPYDGNAQALEETSIPLDKVLATLGETKGKDALAFVDACFSGAGGRSVLPKDARPLIRLKEVSGPKSVALYSASSGVQISGPSADGKNGVFTKYLLQAIGEAKADQNADGTLTMEEVASWVTNRVETEAKQQNRDQRPQLVLGKKVGAAKDLAVAWGLR